MKYIDWDQKKNERLKKERGISFDTVAAYIVKGMTLGKMKHPNTTKYPHQWIYIIKVDNYVYAVPFVYEHEDKVFLKTIIPSRKLTKQYLNK